MFFIPSILQHNTHKLHKPVTTNQIYNIKDQTKQISISPKQFLNTSFPKPPQKKETDRIIILSSDAISQ